MTNVTVRTARLWRALVRRPLLAGMLCLTGLVAAPVAGAGAAATAPAQRVGGSIVRLPSDSALRAVRPGGFVKASVRPSRRPSRQGDVAVITLARVGRGAPVPVARQTLRLGTFLAQVLPARRGRYRLRVTVGRAYTQVTFDVKLAPPPPPGPCTAPLDVSAELGVDSGEPAPGDAVTITLTNTGRGCLETGYGFAWQVDRDGAWVDVPLHRVVPAILLFLQPGASLAETFTVPATTPPGLYRVVKHFTAAGHAVDADVELTVVDS